MCKPISIRISLLFLFFLTSLIGNAQQCLWAKKAYGTGSCASNSVATDLSGNVFISGVYSGGTMHFGTISVTNTVSSDIFLAKYDSVGNALWVKTFSGGGELRGMTIDTFGNIYLTGTLSSAVTFGAYTVLSPNGNEIFMVKLNNAGTVKWAKGADGPGGVYPDRGMGVAADHSGNVFITGYYQGGITFGSVNLFDADIVGYNMFLVKYDSVGNVTWAKTSVGNSGYDQAYCIATDKTGNVYVGGSFSSATLDFDTISITCPPTPIVPIVGFLVKYNGSSGDAIWAKAIGDTGLTVLYGLTIDDSGNIYTAGGFQNYTLTIGSSVMYNAGGYTSTDDIFLAKYNSSGGVLWAKSAGGADVDGASAVTTDGNGHVYLGGFFISSSLFFGSITLSHPGLFLAEYTNSGNAIWAKCNAVAGPASSSPSGTLCAAKDNFGHVYTTGIFNGALTLDTCALVGVADPAYDIFLAKYGFPPSGISSADEVSSEFVLYPNPALNKITIAGSLKIKNIVINNMVGEAIYTQEYDKQQVTIDISSWSNGVYFIRINNIEVRRFVKQ